MSYKPLYTLKTARTPLPSQMTTTPKPQKPVTSTQSDKCTNDSSSLATNNANTPDPTFFRAANEDDDGYDPYSDRQERVPFFEEDPWN